MRLRFLVLIVFVPFLTLGNATPSVAQGPFYEFGVGRGALVFGENPRAHTFAFAFAAQGFFYSANAEDPLFGEFGCAGFETAKRGVFGCGELSDFSIDDDLGTASARGSFDGTVMDFETGKSSPGGKISFAASWKASGDPAPFVDAGFHFEPSHFIGLFAEPDVVRRDASDGAMGKVTSRSGSSTIQVLGAATFAGGILALELHA
jgi:hypothetical protein